MVRRIFVCKSCCNGKSVEMKERFGIVNIVKEIQETDIPKLSHYADKEANPLYPVPKLMDASELEKFYYMLMSLTSKENTSEAEK